ncbi:MAG: ATP synthase F1 subunit delta [Leptonema sp. (in: bacteria)]
MIFENLPESYAKALLDLTSGEEEQILEYFKNLNIVLNEDDQIRNFFYNPAVNKSIKIQVIKKIFSGMLSETFLNFLCVLAKNERMEYLPKIYEIYRYYYDQKCNILPVKVITAIELHENLRNYIRNALNQYFNKQTDISFIVQPKVIGGIVIQSEGKEIDTSIFTKLKFIHNNLKSAVIIGEGYED